MSATGEFNVRATAEGSLLKPVTSALIKRGRGILKRQRADRPLSADWAEHKKHEKELEERRDQYSNT